MDSDNRKNSGERIIQSLSQIGEIHHIHHHLVQDFEGTMSVLERIPKDTIDNILEGSSENPENLMKHIVYVRNFIHNLTLLKKEYPTKDVLAKKMERAIHKKIISEESLSLALEYLEDFCTSQIPVKIKDWSEMKENDNDHGYDDYDPNMSDIYPSDEHREITKNEKRALEQCILVIRTYIENLDMLVFHIDIDPELKRQGIMDEKKRLSIAKKICEMLRRITELSRNYQPYHDLSYPRSPFNNLVDLIIRWENIDREIRQQQEKQD